MSQLTTTRTEYIAGLRALADVLERHPDLELPYDGNGNSINVIPYTGDKQRDQLAAWARVLPGAKTKTASNDGKAFYLSGALRGLQITVICDRNEVCERVVTGSREVVTTVPDPVAVAALPTVEVTTVVEDVEWVCRPVLAAAPPLVDAPPRGTDAAEDTVPKPADVEGHGHQRGDKVFTDEAAR